MVERTTVQETPDGAAKSSDLVSLLAGVGFALFWAVVVLLIASAGGEGSGFNGSNAAGSEDSNKLLSVFSFFLGFALTQYTSYSRIVEQPIDPQISYRVVIAAALLTIPYLSYLTIDIASIALPWLWQLVPWVCFGVSAGLLLPGWGTLWTQLDSVRPDSYATSLHISIAVIGAAVASGILFFLPSPVQQIAVVVFYLGSISLLWFCVRQLPVAEFIDLETSRKHFTLFSRMMVSPFVTGLAFAIAVGLILAWFGSQVTLLLLLIGAAAAGIVMVIVLVVVKHVPRHSTLERWNTPVLAVFLVFLCAIQSVDVTLYLYLAFTVLIACLCFSFISHFNVLTALSYRHNVHTVYHYMQGLIAPLVGTVIGTAICILAFWTGWSIRDVSIPLYIGLLLLLVLAGTISPYASNKTVDRVFEVTTDEEMSGSWRLRCRNIAEEYRLSPREVEVFQLLAKGRNAEHISKTLIISLHTVKTHISRIYRKLQINSQQELINLVDKRGD
jgi:DNA-binding CsgD family transcriptional regulator